MYLNQTMDHIVIPFCVTNPGVCMNYLRFGQIFRKICEDLRTSIISDKNQKI